MQAQGEHIRGSVDQEDQSWCCLPALKCRHRFKYVKVLVFQGATGAEKHLGENAKKYKFLTTYACRYYVKLKRLYCLIVKVSPFTFFPMQIFLHAYFIRFM